MDFPDSNQPKELRLDPEWLAILTLTKDINSRINIKPSKEQIEQVKEILGSRLVITPDLFERNEAKGKKKKHRFVPKSKSS